MNIFYVQTDPKLAAKDLCDEHILKMGIETAQLYAQPIGKQEQKPLTKEHTRTTLLPSGQDSLSNITDGW